MEKDTSFGDHDTSCMYKYIDHNVTHMPICSEYNKTVIHWLFSGQVTAVAGQSNH